MKIVYSLVTFLFLTTVQSQKLKTKEQNGSSDNMILKGQILDKETSESIPFATLILKKEEIYRVADENGFFEIPVMKHMDHTASVSISSMGYKSRMILLKELNDKVYLVPRFEALSEVLVTGYTPSTVLKTAIDKKKENHPVEDFNFYRYERVVINKSDTTALDLELITKDHDEGYLTLHRTTQRVEQVKWNSNKQPEKFRYYSQLQTGRESAIRYANIFHKRKYKNFTLNFVKSINPEDEELYIISFETDRDNWKYTNRGYPTKYSGKIYIDKENFAIVRVIENWETTLSRLDIDLLAAKNKEYVDRNRNVLEKTLKQESICYYADHMGNGIYYPKRHFNRRYEEIVKKDFSMEHNVYERESHFFDFELEDIEEIEYEYFEQDKKQTLLNRVDYDETFWESFYEREAAIISE